MSSFEQSTLLVAQLANILNRWANDTLEPEPQFESGDFGIVATDNDSFVAAKASTRNQGLFQFAIRFPRLCGGQGTPFWSDKTIVITRLNFQPGREGHGSSFLYLLAQFAQAHGFEQIGFEFIPGPTAFNAFALKYGFQQVGDARDFCRAASVRKLLSLLACSPGSEGR